MKLVENVGMKGVVPAGSAALYYKTEPLFMSNVNQYVHVNNWMILEMLKILTSQGYLVDLIDRNCHDWAPKKTYDIFLGLGVGNAGKNFTRHATLSGAPKKVLLAMGPARFDDLVRERYDKFYKRTGVYAPPMRLSGDLTDDKLNEIIETTDFIFNAGEENSLAYKSFLKYGKPVLNIYPPCSPAVTFDPSWLHTRDINSFLCFSGNGFICKGVDLVVESFLDTPEKDLHICGPQTEKAFFQHYGPMIDAAPNIHYHGFITPGGPQFNQLVAKCSYVVFHSAAESCATSVTTAMKAGLVPIINKWTSINIDEACIEISEDGDLVKNITDTVDAATRLNSEEYQRKVALTLERSELFSEKSFSESFTKALNYVLQI